MARYNPVTPAIIEELKTILGERGVVVDPEKLHAYSHDEVTEARYHRLPEVVVYPETAEQVAAVVRLANRELIPVVPRGAGTGLACGAVPVHGGIVVAVERMNRIIEVNAEAMYMEVEAGARTEDVQQAAGAAGLFYAGDPCSGDSCFIGGNVATNAGGNKAVKYGTTRDQVYAIEVVTPTGEITTLGGRLKKSSTGYPLEQLVMGAEGTLGIITKVTLKLLPLPRHVLDLLLVFPDIELAIGVIPKLVKAGVTPTCVEFMDNDAIRSVEAFTREKLPHDENGNYLILQVEADSEEALEDMAAAVDEVGTANGAFAVLVPDSQKIWKARKSFAEAVRHETLTHSNEDIVVPVDLMPQAIRELDAICKRHSAVARTVSHAGDGNIHLSILQGDIPDEFWCEKLSEIHRDIYEYVYSIGGKLSGEHGIGYKRRHLMEEYTDPVELGLMKAVKLAWDPNLVLNPGKIFEVEQPRQ
ncbi:FAD-binding oxidoreductase [Anaeroselena agilis]|uniref:FAD-binding oxidoreductase n=1 Tax=Anaeroselena agilis TaxID=3063788 RepID=A0ABU3P194_9FIRM|nr:FAD-binding oxidoreductase [Selenomonadales bacterium 4137-cl]